MSRDEKSWTLARLGVSKPIFVLQKHLPVVNVGRLVHSDASNNYHCEFRRKILANGEIYWNIISVGSETKTYVNEKPINPNEEIGLNDRDIISLERNLTSKNDPNGFVYLLCAPEVWDTNENTNTEKLDDTISEDASMVSPSGSKRKLLDIENKARCCIGANISSEGKNDEGIYRRNGLDSSDSFSILQEEEDRSLKRKRSNSSANDYEQWTDLNPTEDEIRMDSGEELTNKIIANIPSPQAEPNSSSHAAIATVHNQIESFNSGSMQNEGGSLVEPNVPQHSDFYMGPSTSRVSEDFPRFSYSNEVMRSKPKSAKMISPLPQPHRKSHLRGISSETAERMFKQNKEKKKSKSNGRISKKPSPLPKAERQRKLQEIAKNQKQIPNNFVFGSTAEDKTPNPMTAKSTEFNLLEQTKPSKHATTSEGNAPRVAETFPVDGGKYRSFQKMKFDNVVMLSQNVMTPSENLRPLSYKTVSPENPTAKKNVLLRILKWSPSLLDEHEKFNIEPKVAGDIWRENPVPSRFEDDSEYTKTFYPLMLQNLWATVFKDYLKNKKSQQTILTCIKSPTTPENGTLEELNLYGLLTDKDVVLSEGWLVTLNLRHTSTEIVKCGQNQSYFGFVTSCKSYPKPLQKSSYDNLILNSTPKGRSQNFKKAMDMKVTVKRLSGQLDSSKLFVVTAISRISLQLFEALSNATDSRLFKSILNPIVGEFTVDGGSIGMMKHLKTSQTLNNEQKRIVTSCSHACITDLESPRIMLIQGPPGTGKTTTIVETVLQIFNLWRINNPGTSYPRILITAPSNAAVEELVLKLISFDLEDDQLFNMMTVGIKHSAHRSININDIIFERKLEGEMGKILKLEAEDRKAKLILLLEELQNETDEDKLTQLNIKIKAEKEFIRTAEESKIPNPPENVKSRLKEMATEQVLGPVDIIATTLSGSMDSCMEKFFVTKDCGNSNLRPFSICIVDNAGQCVEPEMLIPFALGFTKLIMVGDPVQLPTTVSSQLAKDMKYDESMFKRFIKFFEGSKSTTLKLDMQYRMHPEITNWPNSYFYEGALANGPQNREFPFQNYFLFDMPRSTEQLFGSDGLFNEKEAEFVANLVKALRDQKLRRSIGVITFYLKQKNRIAQKLKERGLKVSNDLKANIANGIKVQTVEEFQGSECDIIIISCVRGEHSYNRKSMGSVPNEQQLNVALTRAKYSLYIVGNFKVLMRDEMWNDLYSNAKNRKRIKEVPDDNFVDVNKLLSID